MMSETEAPEAGELAEAQPDPGATEIEVYQYQLADKRFIADMVRGDMIRHAVGRDEAELKRFVTSALIGEFRLTQEQVDEAEKAAVKLASPGQMRERVQAAEERHTASQQTAPKPQQQQHQAQPRPGMKA